MTTIPELIDNAGRPAAIKDVELKVASAIPVQPIHWLWPGWLAQGKLHVLAGAPGTGKTTIAIALAATVSCGGRWPCGATTRPGNVLVWSGEDDPADTLVPRLIAAGADLGRVWFVGDTRDGVDVRSFDPARDLPALGWKVDDIGSVSLIVVDPVVSAVAGDSHKNTEVRRSLQPLVDMADRLGAAVLGITHFTKASAGNDPTERVTGSIAFGAVARVVLVTAKRSRDEAGPARILARAKSNIGPDGGGYGYDLRQMDIGGGIIASTVLWGPELEGSARELLSLTECMPDPDEPDDAVSFLRELLRASARSPKDVYREAEAAGYSRDQMKRAKARIGAKAIKLGMDAGWMWRLPGAEGSEEREGCGPREAAPFGATILP